MNVCIVSGSSRENNNTIRLARAIELEILNTSDYEVNILEFEDYDIPFFNGTPLSREKVTPFQERVYNYMSKADLVFILSPEYNWFPSAEVINFIHQFASNKNKDLFDEKVFVTAGISSGRGGKIPAVQLSYVLNKIISYLDLSSVVSSKLFESMFTPQEVSESGELIGEESYKTEFKKYIAYSLNLVERWLKNP